MADNGQSIKVSELNTLTGVPKTDRIVILHDPNSNVALATVDIPTLSANLVLSNTAPANSTSNGVAGTIRYDSNYLYICYTTNRWGRITLNTSW